MTKKNVGRLMPSSLNKNIEMSTLKLRPLEAFKVGPTKRSFGHPNLRIFEQLTSLHIGNALLEEKFRGKDVTNHAIKISIIEIPNLKIIKVHFLVFQGNLN